MNDFPNLTLSLESQFELKKYEQQVKELSREELEFLLIQSVRLYLIHKQLNVQLISQ